MLNEWLTDGGFAKYEEIERFQARATYVFALVPAPKDRQRGWYVPLSGDSPALAQWRETGTQEAKQSYKKHRVISSIRRAEGAWLCRIHR
ncbi:hypothetical protein D5039_02745 [Verminephrobacter aporrectodeae subsp. tuberculatae]|uniref:Uncharacterized protein n=1 Tax=Verminephrobacter aporrectodeae subsp. tuberculatae TaxID=1110392 RepID=A0ABT3KP89_9BURK|nr:hypothetical protein [Verminephrobacter aporrectodeae subsp. tuberculatae]